MTVRWSKRPRRVPLPLLAVVLILVVAGALAHSRAVPSDQAGFTADMARRFAAALPGAAVSAKGPLTLTVALDGDNRLELALDTLWRQCQAAPAQCDAVANEHVGRVVAIISQGGPAAERAALIAVVRTADYVEQIRRSLSGQGEPVAAPLVGDLWLVAAVDHPDSIEILLPADLEALGLTREEALSLGRRNLAAKLGRLPGVEASLPGTKIIRVEGDPYESGRIALPESWAELAEKSGGEFIVAVPAPDLLLYTTHPDAAGIAALRASARKALALAPRPLSATVLRWTAGGWSVIGM